MEKDHLTIWTGRTITFSCRCHLCFYLRIFLVVDKHSSKWWLNTLTWSIAWRSGSSWCCWSSRRCRGSLSCRGCWRSWCSRSSLSCRCRWRCGSSRSRWRCGSGFSCRSRRCSRRCGSSFSCRSRRCSGCCG
uniref:Candidate secreted effector n=1 Tax=Meloidogyne incognita TaxID=6306 RepID=A0A914MDN6_MELIC